MTVDARVSRNRGRLRRSLPLAFGLPLLALVIAAMYWHSVLANAVAPTRPSADVVAMAPAADHDPVLAGDVSDSAGSIASVGHQVQSAGVGYFPADGEHAAGTSGPGSILANGLWPAAAGPRAPPRRAA